MSRSYFPFSSKVVLIIYLFAFFLFYSVILEDGKFQYFASSISFSFDNCEVFSSGWDQMICMYLKIPENRVRLILRARFFSVYIRFVHSVNFQFLVKLPVLSSFKIFLQKYTVFANYVFNQTCLSFLVWDFVCLSLEKPIQLVFLPFCFPVIIVLSSALFLVPVICLWNFFMCSFLVV